MRYLKTLLAAAFVALALHSTAWPMLLETADGKRVGGHLVREDDKAITLRVRQPDGQEKVEEFPRSNVKVIHRIDRDRLAKLSKDNPGGYRDLAEELAKKSDDPEARETALRLFLIAAHLDPQQLGRGCLLSMAALAANEAEARRYRAMAYLLDPNHDPSVLQVEASPPLKFNESAQKNFQLALRAFRLGQVESARKYASAEGVAALFTAAPDFMSQQSFLDTCDNSRCKTCKGKKKIKCATCDGSGKVRNQFKQTVTCQTCSGSGALNCPDCNGLGVVSLTPAKVQSLLRAELWITDQALGAEAVRKTEEGPGWGGALAGKRTGALPPLKLETLTPFDPRKCAYRDGQWVAR